MANRPAQGHNSKRKIVKLSAPVSAPKGSAVPKVDKNAPRGYAS